MNKLVVWCRCMVVKVVYMYAVVYDVIETIIDVYEEA